MSAELRPTVGRGLVCSFAAILLLLAVHLVPGQVSAAGLGPNDVARLESVSDATISPDGAWIAYTVSVPRRPFEDEDGPGWTELHVMDREGKSRPFVFGEVTVRRIAWMPDGRSIAFLAKRGDDEETALWAIPVDGGEARRLLEHEAGVEEFSFSPDGTQVAFIAKEPEDGEQKTARDKGFKQEIFEEDGRATKVWLKNLAAESEKPRMLELPGTFSTLSWAPSGSRLAATVKPLPLVDLDLTQRKVVVLDTATGTELARFDNPGKLGKLQWSPDGSQLAFASALDAHDPSPGRLAVVSAAGGPLRYLVGGDVEADVVDFVWQRADRLLAILSKGTATSVVEIGLDGATTERVAGGKACWDSLELAADGQSLALVGDRPEHHRELYRGSLGGDVARLTDLNPWLADVELGQQEVIRYAARDGLEIEAILERPLGEKPGQRYPLIVSVHGGPESHHCNGWLSTYGAPGQMAVARGFMVLSPNYRASTGRGVAFATANHGDPGGKEFDDLVDGVDHLIKLGLVDGKKVGITGGSYGGYATAWGATYYSERFAAGVMFVGISNLISKGGSTDIPDEIYLVHLRKHMWDDWSLFLERSPVYHAQKAKTPLLILHGQDDTRVNPGQSLELYRALRTLGQTPVRYVKYPGEGHGNRKAAGRYDYSLRMLQWFEHYLKGPGGPPPPYELDYPAALGLPAP